MTKADFERSRGETLDESIDRVAASLTAVPPDPGFLARVYAQLETRSSRLSWLGGFAGLAGLAGFARFAGLASLRRGYGGPPELQRRRKSRATVAGTVAATAAAAGALVIIAVIGRGLVQETIPAPQNPETAAAVERVHVPIIREAAAPVPGVDPPRNTRPSRRPQPEVIERSVAAIAALPTPQTLSVDELTVESLTIAPVEFGHLDLASLEVRDIESVSEPKEQ